MKIQLIMISMLFAIVLTAGSCNKKTGNVNWYLGEWKVSLNEKTYNTQGEVIKDTTMTEELVISIQEDELKINANPIKLNTTMKLFKPVDYVLGAGNGGVFFSPDLTNDRINFWFYGSTSAISETATIITKKNNKLVLGAVYLFANTGTTTENTIQIMQTLTLSR